jgi:hypothetical protein
MAKAREARRIRAAGYGRPSTAVLEHVRTDGLTIALRSRWPPAEGSYNQST